MGRSVKIEEGMSAFKVLTGTPTGKRPLGRPKLSWVDNIRIDLKKIGIITRIWVHSVQDRGYRRVLVNSALQLGVL
jgi:hypothetical protein